MSMGITFNAISYTEDNIGKLIKMSKKKYTWEFRLGGNRCVLALKVSKMSNNYSVELNSQLLYKGNKSYNNCFEFNFKIQGISMVLKQDHSNYTLLVQNTPFTNLGADSKEKHINLVLDDLSLNSDDFSSKFEDLTALYANKKLQVKETNPIAECMAANLTKNDKKLTGNVHSQEVQNPTTNFDTNLKMPDKVNILLDQTNTSAESYGEELEIILQHDLDGQTSQLPRRNAVSKKISLNSHKDALSENRDNDPASCQFDNMQSMVVIMYPNDFETRDTKVQKVLDAIYA